MNNLFHRMSTKVSGAMGSPYAFVASLLIVIVWALSGPIFKFSDTWQLVINTGTTIVTFLMVFLIQNTQNRDSKAMHLKLDELLKGVSGARNSLIDLEDMTDEELEALEQDFRKLHQAEYSTITQTLHQRIINVHGQRKLVANKKIG